MKMAKARVCFGGGVGNGFLPFLLSRFSRARPSSLIITAVMLTTASLCIILSFPPSSPPHPPLLLSLSATQLAFSALEQPFRKPIGTQIDLLSISLFSLAKVCPLTTTKWLLMITTISATISCIPARAIRTDGQIIREDVAERKRQRRYNLLCVFTKKNIKNSFLSLTVFSFWRSL